MRNLFLLLLSTTLSLLLAEGLVRAAGFSPREPYPPSWMKVFQPDPENGWTNKPGIHRGSPLPDDAYPVVNTIASDGTRTSPDAATTPLRDTLFFIGCSIAYGWGVSDDALFSNLIAAHTPYASVNLGVAGYSSLQAFNLLKRKSGKWSADSHPAAVLYAMATHHANRSAGDAEWRRIMQNGDGGERRSMPFARLAESGALQTEEFLLSAWPGDTYSALIALAENAWMDSRWAISEEKMRAGQTEIVRQMQGEAAKSHTPFFVMDVYMQPEDAEDYARRFAALNVPFVRCTDPRYLKQEHTVPGDGHPGAEIQRSYAACVEQKILPLLGER